jgi:hypothetical protein
MVVCRFIDRGGFAMSNKLICPHCEKEFDLDQAIRESEHREMADIAAKFGKSWLLVYEYSDCFRQSEFGNVPLKKRLRIMKEILFLFDRREFQVKGKKYRTEWNTIISAMMEICNMQKWGFRNHNYLKAVLVKGSDRLSAEGMTAQEEEERGKGRRLKAEGKAARDQGPGIRGQGSGARDQGPGDMTAEEYCAKHGVKSLGEVLTHIKGGNHENETTKSGK